MSNARDTETSPFFTPEQNQRAEAVACAVAALGPIRQHDDRVAAFEVVELAEFITGRPAEIVDAPEPEKVTECQWPGCHQRATADDDSVVDSVVVGMISNGVRHPACALHSGAMLRA